MNKIASVCIFFGLSLIPHTLVARTHMLLTVRDDGNSWIALRVRLFFSIIDTLGGILTWPVYGKGFAIQTFYDFFRNTVLPKRIDMHDNIDYYLAQVMSNPRHSRKVPQSAAGLGASLACRHGIGMLVGMRQQSAVEAALERYSPRAKGPATT